MSAQLRPIDRRKVQAAASAAGVLGAIMASGAAHGAAGDLPGRHPGHGLRRRSERSRRGSWTQRRQLTIFGDPRSGREAARIALLPFDL